MSEQPKTFAEIDAESHAFRSTLEKARDRAKSLRAKRDGKKVAKDTQAALVSVLERLVDVKRDRTWEPG